MEDLHQKRCLACEAGVRPLTHEDVEQYLSKVNNWHVNNTDTMIFKHYKFKGFYKTMAFVNAVAWISNQENHHPDLEVGYNYCIVKYTTHAIEGLSENDFICAAKVDALGMIE